MYADVGSFTTAKRKARGDGIHVHRLAAATGARTHVQHIGDLTNPLRSSHSVLISAVVTPFMATATMPPLFAIDRETGQARLLNRAATGGNNGVRQAVDASGKYLIVANYASGTVAVAC